MSRRFLVVDDTTEIARLEISELSGYTDLAVLCWAAPETLARFESVGDLRVHSFEAIVGSPRALEEEASKLAEHLALGGSTHRGLPWRRQLAEPLYREALSVQAVLGLLRQLRSLSGRGTEIAVGLRATGSTAQLLAAAGIRAEGAVARVTKQRPRLWRRLSRRLRHSLATGELGNQLRGLVEVVDPAYRWRCSVAEWRRRARSRGGGVTFFSSYLNNSETLSTLEPCMPQPVHWVVTSHAARLGARRARGPVSWLWDYPPGSSFADTGQPETPPSVSPASCGDGVSAAVVREWLAASPTWSYWRETGRRASERLTACWERYLSLARPRLVVMASQWGLEGWLMAIARRQGIPVLQVLHGALGGPFYVGRPILSDAMIVWGRFWRELWPEQERQRIIVFRPRGAFAPIARQQGGPMPRITYVSWPFERIPFYNGSELLTALGEIFRALVEEGRCALTIRVHPLENVSDLLRRWPWVGDAAPATVRLSQIEPLSGVLADTDVALLFRSTVLLDCFANGIPVVMSGWIDFGWNDRLTAHPGVYLARDFGDLRRGLEVSLQRPRSALLAAQEEFLRAEDEGRDELEAALRQLMDGVPGRVEAAG